MKKIFLLFIIFGLIYGNEIDDAINLYKTKQYKKAYKVLFKLLEKNNYKSDKLNFYFALSAEQIGKYKEALGAIERLLIYNPDNIRLLLERARIYFLLKNYEIAKQYFKEVYQKADKQTQKEIDKFLLAINKVQKRDFVTLTFLVGFGYDSNINNTSNKDKWNLYFGDVILPVTNNQNIKKSTTSTQIFSTKYTHKFDDFIIDNNFLLYFKQYHQDNHKNIELFRYSPTYKKIYKNMLFISSLNYSYLRYNQQHYLSTYGIKQDIKFRYKNMLNTLSFIIDNKIYKNNKQNATLYSISNQIDKTFKKNKISFMIGFDKNKKHHTDLSTIDYNNYKTSFKNSYLIKKDIIFDTSIKYEFIKYTDYYTIFKTKQIDKKTTLNVGISKNFKNFILQTNFQYINNDSNIAPFEYKKWNLNINIIKSIKGL